MTGACARCAGRELLRHTHRRAEELKVALTARAFDYPRASAGHSSRWAASTFGVVACLWHVSSVSLLADLRWQHKI